MPENLFLSGVHKIASRMTDSLGSVQEDVEGSHFTNDGDVKMHQIAMDIYNEFESILHAYGEKPLSTLVPLVANLLEMLNEFGLQKDKMAKELDMLKDHHTVLLSKYETAKVDSKVMEEHMFTLEDELHETKKKLETLKQANISSQRLLELKLKNSIDQICRLEERESELRSAYANLRQRYGDLFRAHVEYLEKVHVSADTSRDSAEPTLSGVATKAGATLLSTELSASGLTTGISGPVIAVSHKGDSPYDWGARKKIMQNICETTPELTLDLDGSPFSKFGDDKFDEVSVSERSEGAEGDDTSSNNAPKRDSVVDFNVSREVSKLVKENNELEETKNALNVVIHDLLTQLEDLTVEKNQLKETLSQFQVARSGTQLHIAGLEQELTRLKKELNTVLVAQRNDEPEEGTPFSKRTRFTRDEMARVLLERNQLKEDLYELRESMRWSEVLRARGQDNQTDLRPWLREPGHRSGFLSFFSRLFRRPGRHSSVDSPTAGLWNASVSYENSSSHSTEGVRIGGQGTSGETSANLQYLREPHPTRENRRRNSDTPRHQQVSRSRLPSAQPPSVCNGTPEKLTAASKGWIPAPVACRPCAPQPVVMRSMENLVGTGGLPPRSSFTSFSPPPLPTPLYRRPIPEALSNRMQISHATCTFQDVGSILPSGEVLAGRSTFFTPIRSAVSKPTLPAVIAAASSSSSAANQLGSASVWPTECGTTHLSSEVWMCLMGVVNAAATWTSEGHSASPDSWTDPQPAFCSQIVVVDATNPARYVESFSLPRSVVTAMTAVPGASVKDYDVLRYSHSVWEAIPFVSSPPSHSQQSHQHQQQPHQQTRGGRASPASRSQQSALGDAPSSPLLTESSSSIGQASIATNNALSSLQNFVTPGSADDGDGENRRSSAFQPEAPGSSSIHQDFYRVERQHFYRHSCSSPSPLVGSSSCAGSRFCPLLTEAATAQQTVWLGCQNGDLFLHCSMTSRYRCLQTTRMPSGVTAICHFSGRVFVSLADGHIVVFRRQAPPATHASTTGFRGDGQMRADPEEKEIFATATATATIPRSASQDTAITSTQHHLANSPDSSDCLRNDVSIGSELAAATAAGGPGGGGDGDSLGCALEGCWDLSEACVITCGPPQHAVKALVIVPPTLTVWAAYGNHILVIDTTCFQKLASFEVHPATTTQVKCMCWVRDGVWISLRRQPILRLFDAFSYSPLQEVDLSTILAQSLNSPDLCRPAAASVTALQASSDHLWVGTQSGVIAIAPFTSASDHAAPPLSVSLPVGASTPIRNAASSALMPPTQDPVKPSAVVNFSETSVSLYGHSEAVNFLTIVSATGPKLEAPGITDTKVASELQPPSLWNSNNSMGDFLMFSGGVGFVTHRVPSQSDSKPLSTGAAGGEGVQGAGAKEPTTPPKAATYESVGHLVAWSIPHHEQPQLAPASFT